MKHVLSTVGVTGVAVGVLAGAGSANLLADTPEPVKQIIEVPTHVAEQPEDPDRLVARLKQHRQ